jgi:outer membrane cobalamin receptor
VSRRRRCLPLLLAVLWAAPTGLARAAEPGGDAGAPPPASTAPRPLAPVEKVTVHGTTDEVPLDPTAFGTVIRAEDFAGRLTTVTELLRETVGVQVRSLGSEFETVSIRGSSADQVMVYLDGVPLNSALGGGVNLATLPLAQIDSIEIYRGFTPASLPSASIGGAVLIHSRPATTRLQGALSATAGSFASGESTGSLSGPLGAGRFHVGVDAGRSAGDFAFRADQGTFLESADDRDTIRRNNDYQRLHLAGRYERGLGERTKLTVTTDLFRRDQGVPGLGDATSDRARLDTSRVLWRAAVETPGLAEGRLLLRGAADYAGQREALDDRDGQLGFKIPSAPDNRIGSFGQEAGATWVASSRQAISLLAALRQESADLHDLVSDPADLGRALRRRTVLTLEDQIALGDGRVLLNPSIRREQYAGDFRPGPSTGQLPESLLSSGARTTGKVGLRIRAGGHVDMKANAGTFLRLPAFTEMFGDRGSVRGNPALVPEHGRSFDLGVGLSSGPRPAGARLRQARLELTLFDTRTDDLIVLQSVAQGVVQATNISRARVQGVELTAWFALGSRLHGGFNVTRQRAVDRSGGRHDGRLLQGRPVTEISADAGIELGRQRLGYNFTYVGPNFIESQNLSSQALPRRYLHDLSWSIRLPHGLQGTIEIRNLFDDRTYDVARFPLPGRSLSGRLAWSF